jgi:glycosyltransferase involved in cell wall biosynthesis
MKICIIAMTGLYPIDGGGPANVAYFLARELGRRNVEVVIFIRADEYKFNKLLSSPEINELRNVKIIPINIKYEMRTFLNLPLLVKKIIETSNQIKDVFEKCDVIIYNSPPVDITIFAPQIAKFKKKKQIFIIHGGLFYESNNIIGKFLIKIQKSSFDRFIAVSNFTYAIALHIGINPDKICIINNGINLSLPEKASKLKLSGSPKILYVGRLDPIKNIETLIYAFAEIRKEFPLAKLYLVGDGKGSDNLKKLAVSLGVQENISFEGFVKPGREVLSYYKSCDLFVLPSKKENFPITILEAMASKIPVILSDISGGPRELVKHKENGLLFEPGNPHELASMIALLARNQELCKKFVETSYLRIKENYSWENIGERYYALCVRLLNEAE